MYSENNKTFDLLRMVFNLADKMDLRRDGRRAALSDLRKTHGRIWKNCTETINLKYQEQHGVKNLNYDRSYSVSDIQDYFKYTIEKHETICQ